MTNTTVPISIQLDLGAATTFGFAATDPAEITRTNVVADEATGAIGSLPAGNTMITVCQFPDDQTVPVVSCSRISLIKSGMPYFPLSLFPQITAAGGFLTGTGTFNAAHFNPGLQCITTSSNPDECSGTTSGGISTPNGNSIVFTGPATSRTGHYVLYVYNPGTTVSWDFDANVVATLTNGTSNPFG